MRRWGPAKGTPFGLPDNFVVGDRVSIRPHGRLGVIAALPVRLDEGYLVRMDDGTDLRANWFIVDRVEPLMVIQKRLAAFPAKAEQLHAAGREVARDRVGDRLACEQPQEQVQHLEVAEDDGDAVGLDADIEAIFVLE